MIQPGSCEGGEDEEYEKYKESIKALINDEYKDADIGELEEVIERLGKEQDEAIILQEFERAAHIRDKAMQLKRNRGRMLTERRERNIKCDDKEKDEEKVKERRIEPGPAPKRPPFNERARNVMSLARQEALRLNVEFITSEHILLGIIQEGGGAAGKVLKNHNVDLKRIRQEIEKLITPLSSPTLKSSRLPWSPRATRVIENACRTAGRLGHDVVGTEHLLLGLLMENEGIAPQVLASFDLKLEEVRDIVLNTHSTGTWSPWGGRLPRTGR
jgi:ATP-dependent Clp protease ATP-binding subunit ClpA